MTYLLNLPLTLIKFIILFLYTTITWILCNTIYYWLNKEKFALIIRLWAKGMLILCNIRLITRDNKNPYFANNRIIIANHTSWLDIIILYALYDVSFIGKHEMKNWPFLNSLIKAGGTLFINRQNKKDTYLVNQLLSQQLKNGASIAFSQRV